MGLLAKLDKSKSSTKNTATPNDGGSGFESTFNPESLNQYDFDAFKRGDFSSFKRATPEETERAKKNAKEMKEQRKLHTGKMAADSDSLDSAAAIFKSEQYHLRRRAETLLGARGEWVKTQNHFQEKIQPGLHEQNLSLNFSQVKGQGAIDEVNQKFDARRQALAELMGG